MPVNQPQRSRINARVIRENDMLLHVFLVVSFLVSPGLQAEIVFANGFERGLPPDPADVCDSMSLPRRPFQQGTGSAIGSVAGNFEVNRLNGPWDLSENWTGCDSYVFLTFFQGDEGFWQSSPEDLFEIGPFNVHYFFVSNESEASARLSRVEAMRSQIETALESEQLNFWQGRIHYVTDKFTDIDGSIGDYATNYLELEDVPLPQVLGIARDQRFDPGGTLVPFPGMPPELGMATYLGHFYNGRQEADDLSETRTGSLDYELISDSVMSRRFLREVELPSEGSMQTYDSLEFDIQVACPANTPFNCSQWDRVATISVCSDAICSETRELVRWITPYWRRGRRHWVVDASPLLPLLESGGVRTFEIVMGPDWEPETERDVAITMRLWRSGVPRPQGIAPAFRGGALDQNYNIRQPVEFALPAEANRVELVALISGHGVSSELSCAEYCDHRHHFTLNGGKAKVFRDLGEIGSPKGCAQRANEGVPAGQWAVWATGRAFWCPGLPVALKKVDLTEDALPGAMNTLNYRATIGTAEPSEASGNIILSSYLVWYED